mgnify:FL=1
MAEKRILTEKDILNKKFKKDIKGYDAQEVDYFLDEVIKDYISFQKEETALNAEIATLRNQIHQAESKNNKPDVLALKKRIHDLELENASYKNKLSGLQAGDKVNVENFDYIKRMRLLENFIWQLGFDPQTFKKRNM